MQPAIFVLAALHHHHESTEGYTYWHLKKIIDTYNPDMIGIEVTPARFAAEDFRVEAPEKWGIALAWGREHDVPVIPMDGVVDDFATNDWGATYEEARERFERETGRDLERVHEEILDKCLDMADANEITEAFELTETYQKPHSSTTQDVFRATHGLSETVFGQGPLSGDWTPRNNTMARRMFRAIKENNVQRAIVVVGAEHKYALDDLFTYRYGLRLQQLSDFLSEPITLTDDELAAFRRNELPIVYPSDLMLIHRTLHGGEPNSFALTLPDKPDKLQVRDMLEKIEKQLSKNPKDPEMHYYRGLYWYIEKQYLKALEDFKIAAVDKTHKIAVTMPLWELATLREGQMQDLLGDREAALACYKQILKEGDGTFDDQVSPYIERPFVRP